MQLAIRFITATIKEELAFLNAAGNPNASSSKVQEMLGPNALLPVIAYKSACMAGVSRFIHISSSTVQGDIPVLDSSYDFRPFSPYSQSKVLGEQWLSKEVNQDTELVIYRPPSVHSRGRSVTQKIEIFARSRLASVSGDGADPSPQALLENVADAIVYIADSPNFLPDVVHPPGDGLTSESLLIALGGGREPKHLPLKLSKTIITICKQLEKLFPKLSANRRRLELLWFGQDVDKSWLESAGWVPPLSLAAWERLARGKRTA